MDSYASEVAEDEDESKLTKKKPAKHEKLMTEAKDMEQNLSKMSAD